MSNVPNIEDIFKKLDFVGRGVLFKYINDESHNYMLEVAEQLDDCILAMLIDNFPDKSYEEIQALADLTSKYREDQETKLKKLKTMNDKEKDIMSKDVADRSIELVVEGKNQNAAIKILTKEFPSIPKATLVKAYKLSKESVKSTINETVIEAETDEEINEMVEYILEENPPVKSRFKVKNISVAGEYMDYEISVDKKTINGLVVGVYISEAAELVEKLEKEIEILLKHKKELENKVKEIKEVEKEFLL